jgi:hypothetical protein
MTHDRISVSEVKEITDFKDRLARHGQFWGPKFEGEGAYIAVGSPLPQFRAAAERRTKWLDVEYRLNVLDNSFENAFFLGDAVPMVDPDFGSAFLPALLGRPYRVDDITSWFDVESFEEPEEIFGLSLQKDGEYYRALIDFTAKLCGKSEGRYLVGTADAGCELDILAALYNRESLLIDMLEEPDMVLDLLSKIGAFWSELISDLDGIIRRTQPYTISWVPIANTSRWAPLICELAAMVSPDVFREIAIPSIRRMSRMFDKFLFNVDGDSYIRYLPEILKLERLHSIEWDPNPMYHSNGSVEKNYTTDCSISVMREILRHKKLVLREIPAWQVPILAEKIPLDGVFFYLEIESADEAEEFMEMAEKWIIK